MQVGADNSASGPAWFRGDIDGLRAVAIVLVVAFHAGVPGFAGGFIGVDVFFVISGYLITKKLTDEAAAAGRIRLVRFWANRARRLVPAMALMVVVTFALSALVLSPVETRRLPQQGASAVLDVSNILFARADTGYFAETDLVSPFLHTWSLSLEEQFYLLWPLLIALTALVVRSRRSRWMPRGGLVLILGVGSAVSFALSVVLTRSAGQWAFYSLPTRAWEFGVAGLLAVVAVPATLQRRRVRAVAVVVGAALLGYATWSFDQFVGYPGFRAAVPVAGTILLVFAGTAHGDAPLGSTTVLSARPLQWLGRVSYSWYLWHWPFMVLAVALLDSDEPVVRVAAGLVALPVAAAVHRWFEQPIRVAPRLVRSPRVALGVAAGLSVVALGSAALFAGYSSRAREPYAELIAAKEDFQEHRCAAEEVSPSGISYCVNGAVDGPRTVMLVGDSHALQWQTAFGEVASRHDIRVVTRWKGGCPSVPVPMPPSGRERSTRPCTDFRTETLTLVGELRPDAVVISNLNGYAEEITARDGDDLTPDEGAASWRAAYLDLARSLGDRSARVGRIVDNPAMTGDPLVCASRPGNSIESCRRERGAALASTGRLRDAEAAAAADLGGIPTLETVDAICDTQWCDVERDGVYVFADPNHLTKAWASAQADQIEQLYRDLGLL